MSIPANNDSNSIPNYLKSIGNDVICNGKEIIGNAGEAVKDKCKGIKDKLIGFCNFLRHAGVALGTALGVVAGLVAAGVVAITLPVSLPVLGAIAGGLFLGGAIVTLIHNIRDPYIKGAKNVIIQTLKDIGSGMLGAIPTIISFIQDPKQIGKVINFLKTQAEDVKKDVENLKNVLENAGKQLAGEMETTIEDLQSKIKNYQDKINGLTKEGIEEGRCNIEELGIIKGEIGGVIGKIKGFIGDNKTSLTSEQQKHLDKVFSNLNKSFDVKQLDKSFQTLNESFSKNSSKETDKTMNASSINIKKEVEKKEKTDESFSWNIKEADKVNVDNNIKDEIEKEEVTKDDKKLGNLEISGITNFNEEITTNNTERSTMFTAQELQDIVQEIKSGNNNNPKRSVIENQNPENKVVNLAENNKSEKAEELKTENKIENQKEVVESNDVKDQQKIVKNDPKNQLNKIQKAFEETGLAVLKKAVRDEVRNCSKNEEESYNKILANIKKLEVFQAAIEDLQRNARTPDTLNDIKELALEAVQSLEDDAFVQSKNINLGKLNNAIDKLGINDGNHEPQYQMSVEVGGYGWNSINFLSSNYERNINASLQFNGNIVKLALA